MNKEEKVLNVFQNISENYDAANDRISLGMQTSWKKHLTDAVRASGVKKVLDVCCGTGDISLTLAKEGLDVVGLDFSSAMLNVAKEKEAASFNKKAVSWIEGNAMKLPFEDDAFDCATISFGLRNTKDYKEVLTEMKRVTKHNVYVLDSFIPTNKLVYPFYRIYFKNLVPLIGGVGKYKEEYQWLFESTDAFLRPTELEDLLYQVGFAKVLVDRYNFGTCCLFTTFQ